MRNSLFGLALSLSVIAGSAALLSEQQAMPGMSPARMWINNRTREEAISVSIANVDPKAPPVPVSVNGIAFVDFTDRAVGTLNQIHGRTQSTVNVRQPWEYREVQFTANQSMAGQLNSLGSDSWEVTGVTSHPNGSSTVLLKRPR